MDERPSPWDKIDLPLPRPGLDELTRELLQVHKNATDSVDPRSVRSEIVSALRTMTLNGFPIDIQGNDILVATSTRQETTRQNARSPDLTAIVPTLPVIAPPPPLTPPPLVPKAIPIVPERPNLDTPYHQIRSIPKSNLIRNFSTKTHTNPHRPHDPTTFGDTLIPVKLTRADNKRTILAMLDAPTGYVVDGADPGERTIVLPGADDYYKISGATIRYTFECSDASTADDGAQVLILDGLVYGPNDATGVVPVGMGADDYTITVADGNEIWLVISYDVTSMVISTVALDVGAITPDDDVAGGTKYHKIADVLVDESGDIPVVTSTNAQCGDLIIPFFPPPDDKGYVLIYQGGSLMWFGQGSSPANPNFLKYDTDDSIGWEDSTTCDA